MNKTSPVYFIYKSKNEKNCAVDQFDEDKNLSDRLKGCLSEWCEDTTSHGFLNVVKTKNWISRIIWILLIVAGIAYSLLSIFKILFNVFF